MKQRNNGTFLRNKTRKNIYTEHIILRKPKEIAYTRTRTHYPYLQDTCR